jgi:gas vesicle protein
MSEPVPAEVDVAEEQSNTLAWFLAGAIIGATIAFLCTPKSGKDTRQLIAEKAQKGKDAVVDSTLDVVDAGRDMFERGRRLVEDAADLFDRGRKLMRGETAGDV